MVRAGKVLPGWGRATISRVAAELQAGAKGKGLSNQRVFVCVCTSFVAYTPALGKFKT